jgi:hypothetical protein
MADFITTVTILGPFDCSAATVHIGPFPINAGTGLGPFPIRPNPIDVTSIGPWPLTNSQETCGPYPVSL